MKTLHDLTLTSDAVYLTNIISLLVSSCIADQSALETARGFEVDGWGEGGGAEGLRLSDILIGVYEIHSEPVTVEAVMELPVVCALVTC